MADVDTVWVEHLSESECLALLASRPVGRLGVIVDGAPEIFPVNFLLDRGRILFRTDPGNKLHGIERTPSVCFEVDDFDEPEETGWSVLVKGRAAELVDPLEVEQAGDLPLHLWAFGDQSRWVRITPVEVTGRRIWRRPADGGDGDGSADT